MQPALMWESRLLLLAPRLSLLLFSRGLRARGARGRGNSHSAQIMLDKIVKRVSVDGGMSVAAPFPVKIRGTFFDEEKNVDGKRNRMAREELYLARQFPAAVTTPKEEGQEGDGGEEDTDEEIAEEEERKQLEEAMLRMARQDETGGASKMSVEAEETTTLGGAILPASSVLPMHLLLYGRTYHRLDSYSVVHPECDRHCTHVHVSDAVSFVGRGDGDGDGDGEEDGALFLHQHYRPGGSLHGLRACGGAAVWLPHRLRTVFPDRGAEINRDGDKMVAEVKFYLPLHILEAQEHGIRAVFLVPTSLARVSVKTERDSSIEMDGQLQNQLAFVHLMSDGGDIKTRDLYASKEIRLNSHSGDIMCEGVTNGHMVAETHEDGDFLARDIEGPQITVTTDTGDINVWGDCNSDLSQFFTRVGNVHVRYLYGASYILVREAGTVNANLVDGSLTCVVKRGTINASIENIITDSTIQVSEGEITVALPPRPPFRVTISATTTNIAPKLLNSGDFYKRFDEGFGRGENGERENFNTGPYLSSSSSSAKAEKGGREDELVNGGTGEVRAPVLNIVANRGSVTVIVNEESGKTDSAHNGTQH